MTNTMTLTKAGEMVMHPRTAGSIILLYSLSFFFIGCAKNISIPDRAGIDDIYNGAVRYETFADREQSNGNPESALKNYKLAAETYEKASFEYNSVLQRIASDKGSSSNSSSLGRMLLIAVAQAVVDVGNQQQNMMQQKQMAQTVALRNAATQGTGLSGYYSELNKSYASMQKYGTTYEYQSLPDPQTASISAGEEGYAKMAIKSNKAFIRVKNIIKCYDNSKDEEVLKCITGVAPEAPPSSVASPLEISTKEATPEPPPRRENREMASLGPQPTLDAVPKSTKTPATPKPESENLSTQPQFHPTALHHVVLSARPPNRPLVWTFTMPLKGAGAKTLIAYSLQVAQAKLQEAAQHPVEFRQSNADVWALGGITKPWAFVVDTRTNDLILVGERESKERMTLDDLVVALRIQNPNCGVLMPPATPAPSQRATVVFTEGLTNTHFGQVCFDAYRLMGRLALGLEQPRMAGFQTYVDLTLEGEHARKGPLPLVRFWLVPQSQIRAWRNQVLLEAIHIRGFTEVLYAEVDGKAVLDPRQFEYLPATQFAETMSKSYRALAQIYETFASFEALSRLSALTRGLTEVTSQPDLGYWLEHYRIRTVETPFEVPPLRVEREVTGRRIEVHVW